MCRLRLFLLALLPMVAAIGCRTPQPAVDTVRTKADGTLINSMSSRTPGAQPPLFEEEETFEPYVPEVAAPGPSQASQSCPGGVCGPRLRRGFFLFRR